MSIKHTTTVDIGDLRKLSKPIHLMQYDKSLPEIEVHITKDGQEYTIPSGYSATIRWGKPDKHGCTATGTVSGSTVTFQVTEQMACIAGISKVTVEIVESDSSQAGTAKFDVIVDSNPIGDNTIVSDSEIADIQKAIEAGQNAVTASEKATAKANEASTSATTASQKAEEASASAQTAAEKAKEAKASADSVANVVTDVSKLKEDIAYNDDGYFKIDYDIIENEYPSSSGFQSYNNWWRSDYIEVDFRNGFYYKTGRQTGDNYFYDQNNTVIKKFTLTANSSYTKYTGVPQNAKYMVISNEKNHSIKVLNYLLKLGEVDSLNSDLDAFVNGLNITLNLDRADDGKSYGKHRIKGNFYKGGIVTVSNTKEDDYNITCYFKDANGNLTQPQVGVRYGTSKEILVESDAVYLDLYCNRFPMKGSVQIDSVDKYQNEKLEEYFNTANNIVYANSKVLSHIKDAKKLLYGDEVMPLCLLHFSDIHGSGRELRRIMQMADYLGNEIDDVICTGDMVGDKYSDSISFWDNIDGTENVLTCIGNHDVAIPPIYNAYGEGVTMSDAYNKYISPYISNWGAVYTAGHTYYYKDYSAKNIRLIALDYLLTGTDATNQNDWLQARLEEAKSSGYTVVIIEHTPLPNSVAISCGFNMIRNPWTYGQFDSMYQSSVDSFINAGGRFACYLTGHSHGDLVGYNSDYPNQIYIAVTCAGTTGRDNDQRRVVGEKSEDAFNIVVVDTETETIKLIRVGADIDNYLRGRNICTIDYMNKSIISDY